MKGTILIAVGNTLLRRQLADTLAEAGVTARVALDGNSAWAQLLAEGGPRVVFLDSELKGLDGPTLARRLREQVEMPYIHAALIEGLNAPPVNRTWFDTVLTRPLDLGDVVVRAYAGLELMYPHRHQAAVPPGKPSIDRGTGLWTPETFDAFLGACIDASGERPYLTLLGLRFDGLDAVDGPGRHGAEVALRACARSARESIRGTDAIARIGKDTFTCVLQSASEAASRSVVGRIRQRLDQIRASLPGNMEPVRMAHCIIDVSREVERDPTLLRESTARRLAAQSLPNVHLVAC